MAGVPYRAPLVLSFFLKQPPLPSSRVRSNYQLYASECDVRSEFKHETWSRASTVGGFSFGSRFDLARDRDVYSFRSSVIRAQFATSTPESMYHGCCSPKPYANTAGRRNWNLRECGRTLRAICGAVSSSPGVESKAATELKLGKCIFRGPASAVLTLRGVRAVCSHR